MRRAIRASGEASLSDARGDCLRTGKVDLGRGNADDRATRAKRSEYGAARESRATRADSHLIDELRGMRQGAEAALTATTRAPSRTSVTSGGCTGTTTSRARGSNACLPPVSLWRSRLLPRPQQFVRTDIQGCGHVEYPVQHQRVMASLDVHQERAVKSSGKRQSLLCPVLALTEFAQSPSEDLPTRPGNRGRLVGHATNVGTLLLRVCSHVPTTWSTLGCRCHVGAREGGER